MAMPGAEKQRRFRARRKQRLEELERENAELRARVETCLTPRDSGAVNAPGKDDGDGERS
jgi:hypothetical protein